MSTRSTHRDGLGVRHVTDWVDDGGGSERLRVTTLDAGIDLRRNQPRSSKAQRSVARGGEGERLQIGVGDSG